MNFLSKILKVTLIITLIPFILSFLQAYHSIFDSISHFRYHLLIIIALLLGLLVIFSKNRVLFGSLFLISLVYLYIFPFSYKAIYVSKPEAGVHFSHMQFNLNYGNRRVDSVIELLSSKKPDIVTMQEVTPDHRKKLETLKSGNLYPYQTYCDFYQVAGAVAILSRHPMESIKCAKYKGLASATINIKGKSINVASLHLVWPYPYGQYKQVDELKPFFNGMQNSKYRLIAGDFNAAHWSNIVKLIAKESNTDVVGGLRWTIAVNMQFYSIPFSIKLPIDQLLLHGVGISSIEVLKHYGSDHYPVFSRLYISIPDHNTP